MTESLSYLGRVEPSEERETHTHTERQTKTEMGLVVAREILSSWNSLLLNA